ncbi:hypothetical protein Dehly_0493 [Dehalogenimonas lykanthroporepellens BL-DC-9]|nr:hypothetical protein Dehly_0493 [Dehalogenimonas lykanthroporepellens BL-DC-9]
MKWHKVLPAVLLAVVLATGLLAGCAKVEPDTPTGIVINPLSSSIGNVDGDPEKPVKVSYTITIRNKTNGDVFISSVTPVLSGSMNDYFLNQPDDFAVNTTLAPDSGVNVTGELIFDFTGTGFSKAEMSSSLKITSVEVESTFIIDLPA